MESKTYSKELTMKSIKIQPTWLEMQDLQKHIDCYARFYPFNKNQKSKKITLTLPDNVVESYINDAFAEDEESGYVLRTSKQWKQKTSALVTVLWRNDIHVENVSVMVRQLRYHLIEIVLSNIDQSIEELRSGCFKILDFLPGFVLKEFQSGWMEGAINQILIFRAAQPGNLPRQYRQGIGNMFALMVLDEHIRVEELMRRSLDLYASGQKQIAQTIVAVLYKSPFNWIFQHQCQKKLAQEFRLMVRTFDLYKIDSNQWDPVVLKLSTVTNVKGLFEVLQEYQSSLNEEALALAAFKMSDVQEKGEHLLWISDLLQKKFLEIHENFNNAGWLQQFVRGFGLCKIAFKANTRQAVLRQIKINTHKFNIGQCQSILHKFVLLNIRSYDTINGLVHQLCLQIKESDLEALSKTMWSLGILGSKIDKSNANLFAEEIIKRIDDVDTLELTQLFVGMSKMQGRHVQLLSALKRRILTIISEGQRFSAISTLRILSSAILLDFLNPDLLFVLNCFLDDLVDLKLTIWDAVLMLLAYKYSHGQKDSVKQTWVKQQFENIVVKIVNISPSKLVGDLKALIQVKISFYCLNQALDCLFVLLTLSNKGYLEGRHIKRFNEIYNQLVNNEHKLKPGNELRKVKKYLQNLNDGIET
eukprot:TRINITY_DN653_c0_g1_i6.p1 TRINITY_DN653_c0_g1~~TRINITY_DN653_c0_g1_i6.p1  ORF type:complete len:644 (+),score=37.26 TRINITY_DN653_c0_g1_i6:271-2202(+)